MPPNLKFREYLARLASEGLPALENTRVLDHAAPIATSADTIPATDIKSDDNGYFHHDLEAKGYGDLSARGQSDGGSQQENNHTASDDIGGYERQTLQTILHKFSTNVQDPVEVTVDEKRLQRALKDAGTYAYGLQGIAVWIFDDDHDRLIAPPGGFWHNPNNYEPSKALNDLVDKSRPDHVPMVPQLPQVPISQGYCGWNRPTNTAFIRSRGCHHSRNEPLPLRSWENINSPWNPCPASTEINLRLERPVLHGET